MAFPFSIAETLYQAMTAAVSGTTVVDSDDEAYQMWAEAMSNYASSTGSGGLDSVEFWLVVRLKAKDFSETLEVHKKLPMLIPKIGTGSLVGIARTSEELDTMVQKQTDKYVYLTYKIKLQGQHAWRTLLEFLGEHDMLEKQGD